MDLQAVVKLQMAEIDRLRALVGQRDAELAGLVAWIAGDTDALSALQAVYADPRTSEANKIKAAACALPFERSKPASVVVQIDFKAKVRAARLAANERDRQQWALENPGKLIEHQPEGDPAA